MSDVNANIGININASSALAELKVLQRQIALFHASVAKDSQSAALAQKGLQNNLLNSINATNKFTATMGSVRSSTESFTHALETNKLSMREYFRYAGGASKTFGKLFRSEFDTIGKVAEERVKKMQTQYIKMGRDVNGAMKAMAVTPKTLNMNDYATKTALAAQKQAIFNQVVRQGSTSLLNFGKNTQWAGRQLMVGFTVPLMYFGSMAAKTFMDLEAQAVKFKRVYGDMFTTSAQTNKALADVQQLADGFTKYGVAVSKTMEMAASAAAMGKTGSDLTAQVSEATRLAVLGSVEQSAALETTISLTNAFGIAADELSTKINFLNAVENQTTLSIEDLTIAIPKAGPVIKQLGGDVEDLAFFLTAMKEGGINASEGANALKSGLASLINPSAKASAMLNGLGINIKGIVEGNQGDIKNTVIQFAQALDTLAPLQRARAIEQLFGKFQFSRLSTLFQNVAKDGTQASVVLGLTGKSIEELAILSERELKTIEDAVGTNFKASIEQLKLSIAPIGKTFLEAITPIVKVIGNFLDKFNNLSDGTKKFIVIATTLVGVIGPVLLMTFGLLANGAANIIKLFLAMRGGFLKLSGNSKILAEQTNYLNAEQLEAATVAASLNQAHTQLTQKFEMETVAVKLLRQAYIDATVAAAKFATANPGMMVSGAKVVAGKTPSSGKLTASRNKGKKYANGIFSVPGPKGAGDVVPAMLSPGEAVIPAKQSAKYGSLIQSMIEDNIPGHMAGRMPLKGKPIAKPQAKPQAGPLLNQSGRLASNTLIKNLTPIQKQEYTKTVKTLNNYVKNSEANLAIDNALKVGVPKELIGKSLLKLWKDGLYSVTELKKYKSLTQSLGVKESGTFFRGTGLSATSYYQKKLGTIPPEMSGEIFKILTTLKGAEKQQALNAFIGKSFNMRPSSWSTEESIAGGWAKAAKDRAMTKKHVLPFKVKTSFEDQNVIPVHSLFKNMYSQKGVQEQERMFGGNFVITDINSNGISVKRVSGFADGTSMVPGFGNGDTVPAMLTPGETVVSKDVMQQPNAKELVQGLIDGKLQGFGEGTHAVVAYGKHQPFTKAHEGIADLGKLMAEKEGSTFQQFTSDPAVVNKTNVLSAKNKLKLMEESLGSKPHVALDPFDLMKQLSESGKTSVKLLLGSDRMDSAVWQEAALKHGITLEKAEIPRTNESVSATKLRQAVLSGDMETANSLIAQRTSSRTRNAIFSDISGANAVKFNGDRFNAKSATTARNLQNFLDNELVYDKKTKTYSYTDPAGKYSRNDITREEISKVLKDRYLKDPYGKGKLNVSEIKEKLKLSSSAEKGSSKGTSAKGSFSKFKKEKNISLGEQKAIEKALKDAGITITEGQKKNLFQNQISHIKEEIGLDGKKAWRGKNLLSDAGYINNYINTIKGGLGEEIIGLPKGDLKKLGIDRAELEKLILGEHPRTDSAIKTFRNVAQYQIDRNPNLENIYQAHAAVAGVDHAVGAGKYKEKLKSFSELYPEDKFLQKTDKIDLKLSSEGKNVLDAADKSVKNSKFKNEKVTDFGRQISPSSGFSFKEASAIGGLYEKSDGTKSFVKPMLDERAALAEIRATQIAREVHGLDSPIQKLRVMLDRRTGKKLFALESPYDPRFAEANLTGKFTKDEYFKQLVAANLRGDKDLHGGNLSGNVLADVGTAGVFDKASGKRDFSTNMKSMAEQARINLLGVNGGARRFFAESTLDIPKNMTADAYNSSMISEIDKALPKLKNLVSSWTLNAEEKSMYQAMINRLEEARKVDWREFHKMHSAVLVTKDESLQDKKTKKVTPIKGKKKPVNVKSSSGSPKDKIITTVPKGKKVVQTPKVAYRIPGKADAPVADPTPKQGMGGKAAMGSGALGGLGMASAMTGGNEKVTTGLFAASALLGILPMLTSPLAILAAAMVSIAAIAWKFNNNLSNATKEGANIAKSMSLTSAKLQALSVTTGTVSATEIQNRKRTDTAAGANGIQRKFGMTTLNSDFGKGLLSDISKQADTGAGPKEIAKNVANQLGVAITQGVISIDQAKSISSALGEQLKNYQIPAEITGNLVSLFGPNGENLATDPLRVRLEIQKDSMEQQSKAFKNAIELAKPTVTTGGIGQVTAGASLLGAAGATAATGVGAPVAIGLAAVGVASIIKALYDQNKAQIENNKLSSAAIQLGVEQVTQNQGLVDSLNQEYDNKLKTAKTTQEIADIESNRTKDLKTLNDKNKESLQLLIDQKDQLDPGVFADAIKAQADTMYKEGPMKVFADQANEALKGMAESSFKTTLQLEYASGNLDPITLTSLINYATTDKKLEAKYTLLVNQVGGAEANLALQLLSKAGAKPETISTIMELLTKNPENFKANMDAINVIANMQSEYGITVDINVNGVAKIAKVKSIINALVNDKPEITKEIIAEYAKDPNNPNQSEFKGILDNWNTLVGSSKTISKTMTINFVAAGDKNVIDSYLTAKGINTVGMPRDFINKTYGPAAAAYAVGTGKGSKNGSDKVVKKPKDAVVTPIDTSLNDLLLQLKLTRDASINAEGGLLELRRILGQKQDIKIFEGLNQELSNLNGNEDFINFIGGLDEAVKQGYVSVDKLSKKFITLTADGWAASRGYKEAIIGAFQSSAVVAIAGIEKQKSKFKELKKAGVTSKEAIEMLSDANFALSLSAVAPGEELDALIAKFRELKTAQEDLAKVQQDPLQHFKDKLSEVESEMNNFFSKAQTAVEGKYARSILSAEREIEAKQKEVEAAQKNVSAIQDTIDGIQSKIDEKQVKIETDVTRQLRIFEDQIKEYEDQISKTFDIPIADLEEKASDLSNDLSIIDHAAESINKKYDLQQDALNKISELNQNLIAQEKQRISLADALSQGDISAAAQMAQDIQSTASEGAASGTGDSLNLAKEQELGNLRNANGLTRLQIEQAQFEITQGIYKLEEGREAIEAKIAETKVKMQPFEDIRKAILLDIRDLEDQIYNITNGVGVSKNNNLLLANQQLSAAQALLVTEQEKLQVIVDAQARDLQYLNDLKVQWAEVSGKIAESEVATIIFQGLLEKAKVFAAEITAQFDLLKLSIDFATVSGESYKFIQQAIKDGAISDADVVGLATAWGVSQTQARQYLDFYLALNDGVLSDEEILKLGTTWGLTQDEVRKYVGFVEATKGKDGELTDAEISALGIAWGMTTSQVVDYIDKIGAPVTYSGTLLTPGEAANIGWDNATKSLQEFLNLQAAADKAAADQAAADQAAAKAKLDAANALAEASRLAAAQAAIDAERARLAGLDSAKRLKDEADAKANKAEEDAEAAQALLDQQAEESAAAADLAADLAAYKAATKAAADKAADAAAAAAAAAAEAAADAADAATARANEAIAAAEALAAALLAANQPLEYYNGSSANRPEYYNGSSANLPPAGGGGGINAGDYAPYVPPTGNGGGGGKKGGGGGGSDSQQNLASGGIVKTPRAEPAPPQRMNMGGMVMPKYFAVGGYAKGTDTVPAMLTPGEFIMSKYAVDSYGINKMKSINDGSYSGQKVYNYNLSVNVKSDANPQDIARVVMTQIRQVDSQRIRTQRP